MLIYCPVGASWEGAEPGKSADGNWLFVYTCVTGNAGMKAKSYALKSIAPVIPNEEKAVKKALTNNFLSFFFLLRLALIIIELELSARYMKNYRA